MNELVLSEPRDHQIIITDKDVEAVSNRLQLIRKFIASNLREGLTADYAVIPNCGDRKCLLKPGAEKLRMLFGLGVKVDPLKDGTILDREGNFAMFSYRATIFNLRNDVVIAQCDGSANSQETKYRETTQWVDIEQGGKKVYDANGKVKREKRKVEQRAFEILNTLQKMAQKRAIVGATIAATGASDFFTADMERDIPADVQEASSANSEGSGAAFPICCGKPMFVSKFNAQELYCGTCKAKAPRP